MKLTPISWADTISSPVNHRRNDYSKELIKNQNNSRMQLRILLHTKPEEEALTRISTRNRRVKSVAINSKENTGSNAADLDIPSPVDPQWIVHLLVFWSTFIFVILPGEQKLLITKPK